MKKRIGRYSNPSKSVLVSLRGGGGLEDKIRCYCQVKKLISRYSNPSKSDLFSLGEGLRDNKSVLWSSEELICRYSNHLDLYCLPKGGGGLKNNIACYGQVKNLLVGYSNPSKSVVSP